MKRDGGRWAEPMKPIRDFDPLACLQDLQTGFLALAENQRLLNENQARLQAALDLLCASQRRLDNRQDLLALHTGLVIDPQKTPGSTQAK